MAAPRSITERLGPGMWFTLDVSSFHAVTREAKLAYIALLRMLLEYHPCQHECAAEGKRYLLRYPPEGFMDTIPLPAPLTGANNMFYYNYLFHHNVNLRLGKVSPPFADIYAEYSKKMPQGSLPCTGPCAQAEAKAITPPPTAPESVALARSAPIVSHDNMAFPYGAGVIYPGKSAGRITALSTG